MKTISESLDDNCSRTVHPIINESRHHRTSYKIKYRKKKNSLDVAY